MKNIRKVLMKIGISANIQGYYYIIDAVNIIKEQRIHTNMTTIYELLAKKYEKTYDSVERSIRHAIHRAYKNSNLLKNVYESLPDNSAFIYDLVFNFDVFVEL